MSYLEIEKVIGREIIDSRGNPTVEAEVWLADGTIVRCDYTVMIPMTHGVDSLNVAAASAVAFYQLGLQCRDK